MLEQLKPMEIGNKLLNTEIASQSWDQNIINYKKHKYYPFDFKTDINEITFKYILLIYNQNDEINYYFNSVKIKRDLHCVITRILDHNSSPYMIGMLLRSKKNYLEME